ncbi:MAG: hypothetical protein PHD06_11230 [Bacteroidales bacterium]|nr:hypothetical protein [Bacteroidales bacterium]
MNDSISDRLDKLEILMDSAKEGEWIKINVISNNAQEFIEAIKYLIDFDNKPYEFNGNYTKVRRIEHVTDNRKKNA